MDPHRRALVVLLAIAPEGAGLWRCDAYHRLHNRKATDQAVAEWVFVGELYKLVGNSG
jgi:hypothetical protein